jgi:uncharacterized protein YbjQ (UPF0145 family)
MGVVYAAEDVESGCVWLEGAGKRWAELTLLRLMSRLNTLKEVIMLLLTTPNIPGDHKILELFDMVTIYQTIKVSQNIVIEGSLAKNRNEYKEAFDAFRSAVREYTNANAVLSVHISISSQQFSDGTFLYINISGTPVRY